MNLDPNLPIAIIDFIKTGSHYTEIPLYCYTYQGFKVPSYLLGFSLGGTKPGLRLRQSSPVHFQELLCKKC